MTDIPIAFTAPMVRALLDGRKTMTRRLPLLIRKSVLSFNSRAERAIPPITQMAWQNVRPGDRLWVCESVTRAGSEIKYVADGSISERRWLESWKQDPRVATHLPRSLSRLTLIVTTTKIERLQDVSEDDAKAEGLRYVDDAEGGLWIIPGTKIDRWRGSAVDSFEQLWCSIRGQREWKINPEVVELSFDVLRSNVDF